MVHFNANTIEDGSRVGLNFHPFCDGEVIDVQPGFAIHDLHYPKKYKVKWDNQQYGISDWLSENDLIILKV